MKTFVNQSLTALGILILSTGVQSKEFVTPTESNLQSQNEQPENRVTIYSSYGYQSGNDWYIPIRLWVSEDMDTARKLSLKAAREILQHKAGIETLTDEQKDRFRFRAKNFLRDSESNEVVKVQFDNDPDKVIFNIIDSKGNSETDRNGNIQSTLIISKDKAITLIRHQQASNGWLSLHVVSDDHFGRGRVRLIPPKGLSIISDIDDTIKVTQIPSGTETVLLNTFFRHFEMAPKMLDSYKSIEESASFHYVSGGPWQLYDGLSAFLFEGEVGFPAGSLHMKSIRTNLTESKSYLDIAKLINGGATIEQKLNQIGVLLSHFPERDFILIGDSGEHDPEIFRRIKHKYKSRIKEIRIRDIVNDAKCNPKRLAGMSVISVVHETSFTCNTK